MKLQNILITGCSSGIGLETAIFLQKNGIKVYASAREQKDVKMLEDLGLKAFKIDVRNTLMEFLRKTGLQIHQIDIEFFNFGDKFGDDIIPETIKVHIKN